MIELPRDVARLFRAVLRKSVLVAEPRTSCPSILLQTGKQGLTLSCQQGDVALRYHTPSNLPTEAIALPFTLLADLEGRGSGTVQLEQISPVKGRVCWSEGTVSFDTATPDSLPAPPQPAGKPTQLEPEFLSALADATRSTNRDAVRYALQHLMLRGKDGAVVATDGRQLLVQRGYPLPWKDNVLIRALPVFGCRELPKEEPILLGRSGEQVTLEIGPWLLSFKTDNSLRFPDVDHVIPSTRGGLSRLHLDPQDADVLTRDLPKMPGRDDNHSPVILELGEPVRVCPADGEKPIAELVLARSRFEGPAVRACMDRNLLLRAIQLDFRQIIVIRPDKPILCQDEKRTYLWMPLGDPASSGKPAAPQPVTTTPVSDPIPPITRSKPMPTLNGQRPTPEPQPGTEEADPLVEAEALRVQLQETLTRTVRLITCLKQQRRQNRVVQSAMASLRRLQEIGR